MAIPKEFWKEEAKESAHRNIKKQLEKAGGSKKDPKPKSKSIVKHKIKKVMEEFKEGALKSGHSGKKVTNRKQAIAIGLSEARQKGAKIPKKKK